MYVSGMIGLERSWLWPQIARTKDVTMTAAVIASKVCLAAHQFYKIFSYDWLLLLQATDGDLL
jgi:hypothetical protein